MAETGAKREDVAVALRYAWDDTAPDVLISGKGEIAKRIVQMALEHDIPVQANPDLAKLLSKVPSGTPIPPKAFLAVAQILAFLAAVDRRGTLAGPDGEGEDISSRERRARRPDRATRSA